MKSRYNKSLSLLLAGTMVLLLNGQAAQASGTADSPWDAKAEFSAETAEPGVWRYSSSFDGGETFETQTVYAEKDWGNFWYESADEGIGLGVNPDVADYLEVNVSDNNAGIAALAFVAPEAGNYRFRAFEVPNMWDQDGDSFYVRTEDTVYYEGAIENPGEAAFTLEVPEMVVSLDAGEAVYFHATTKGSWYSAYFNVLAEATEDEATAEGTPWGEAGEEPGEPTLPADGVWNAFTMFSEDTANPAPWLYQITMDKGETFIPMTRFASQDWGPYWYDENPDSYAGVGKNNDVEDELLELNAADNNAEVSVLTFVAPEAGNYLVHSFGVPNLWDQDGKEFYVQRGAEKLFTGTIENPGEAAFTLEVPEMVVSLDEGEELHFYGVTIGSWFSVYLNVEVEPTDAEESLPTEEPEETTVEETTVEETTEAATEAPTTAAPTTTDSTPDDTDNERTVWPWVAGGAVVLAIVGGAVYLLTRKRA